VGCPSPSSTSGEARQHDTEGIGEFCGLGAFGTAAIVVGCPGVLRLVEGDGSTRNVELPRGFSPWRPVVVTSRGDAFVPLTGAKGSASTLFNVVSETVLPVAMSGIHTIAAEGDTIYAATYDAKVQVIEENQVSTLTGGVSEVLSLASKFDRLWFAHYSGSEGSSGTLLSFSAVQDPLVLEVVPEVVDPVRLTVVGDRLLVSTENETFSLSPEGEAELAYPYRVMDAIECGSVTWIAIEGVGVKREGKGDSVAPLVTDPFDIACRPGGIWILGFSSGLWSVDV
jgi:hypothetical protein